jgi:hypothetical protein
LTLELGSLALKLVQMDLSVKLVLRSFTVKLELGSLTLKLVQMDLSVKLVLKSFTVKLELGSLTLKLVLSTFIVKPVQSTFLVRPVLVSSCNSAFILYSTSVYIRWEVKYEAMYLTVIIIFLNNTGLT